MNATKKVQGYDAEHIACIWLENQGHDILQRNFTIQGGEIDIVSTYRGVLHIIEVKLINYVEDINDYISPLKLRTLVKTTQFYLQKNPHRGSIQIDVIFIRQGLIYEYFENVTGL